MAYGLKAGGADLAYKGGLFNGNRYAALFSAEGTELTGNNYARVLMALADWQADGSEYENMGVETWGPPNAAWLAIDSWGLFAATSGGTRLFDVDITDTDPPGLNAMVSAAAEALGYSFSGAVTQAGSVACLTEGLLSGTRAITLHPGSTPIRTDAGESSTSNAIATNGDSNGGGTPVAVSVAAGDWTITSQNNTTRRARNNKLLDYGVQAANLPNIGSIALRDGSAHTSNILWTAELSTARNPGLGDDLEFAVNAIVIPLTITAA